MTTHWQPSSPTKSWEKALEEGAYYDHEQALKVKNFIETFCTLSDDDKYGQKVKLLEWTWHDLVQPLYGMKRKDGSPLYTEGSIYTPKKSSKSSTLAYLALYEIISTPGAEVFILSSTVRDASRIFQYAKNAIAQHPALKKRFKTNTSLKRIEDRKYPSYLAVLSGDRGGKDKHGDNASCVFIDELSSIDNRAAYDGLKFAGMARRKQFKLVAITTPQLVKRSLSWDLYQYNQGVQRSEIIDPYYLAVSYGVPDEDTHNPEKWWRHLPSLGIIVDKEFYLEQYAKTKDSPHDFANFRALLLGQWLSARAEWIPESKWMECKGDFTEDDLAGQDCYIGIDTAQYSLSAHVLIFPKDDKYYLLPRFFIPQAKADYYQDKFRIPYNQYAQDRHITITHGDLFDPAVMRASIEKDIKKFRVIGAAWDGHNFEESRVKLENDYGLEMLEVRGTIIGVGEATVNFERWVHEGKIIHNGNPLMNLCVKNCCVKEDKEGRLLIDKEQSGGRYDGVSAAITGFAGMGFEPTYRYTGIDTV